MDPEKNANAENDEKPFIGSGLLNSNADDAEALRTPSPKNREAGHERISRWEDHKDAVAVQGTAADETTHSA